MSHAKSSKRRTKVVPVLGAAGLSLSLAGEAPAATGALTALMVTPNNEARHELTLGEEEIFDVTLATFYVVNKENAALQPGPRFAMGGGGGCGCCAGCAAATGSYGAWLKTTQTCRNVRSNPRIRPGARTFPKTHSRSVSVQRMWQQVSDATGRKARSAAIAPR
jgi:hypothetical protein